METEEEPLYNLRSGAKALYANCERPRTPFTTYLVCTGFMLLLIERTMSLPSHNVLEMPVLFVGKPLT